jgi:hypothetical protein
MANRTSTSINPTLVDSQCQDPQHHFKLMAARLRNLASLASATSTI